MNLQQQIAVELRRRTQLLPQELGALKTSSSRVNTGMGIHQSQIEAVSALLEGLLAKQTERMKVFDDPAKAAALTRDEFAGLRADVELGLTGTHSIMAIFQYVFDQRSGKAEYGAALNAADLIAAYCYLPCMKLANRWSGAPEGRFREPPLTYLSARKSPVSITRHKALDNLGLTLYEEQESSLPIPVISLSFHNTAVLWTYCSLYHEVGHLLDQDLALRAALAGPLKERLGQSGNQEQWGQWLKEMIADAFGVILGGAGFADSLMSLLFNTAEEVVTAGMDKHPNSYVRVFLISALLRSTGVPALGKAADEMGEAWRALYGEPDPLKTYIGECEKVAAVLLDEPLDVLGGRRLRDFAGGDEHDPKAPDSAQDHDRVLRLADYLRFDFDRPAPEESWMRLVPAAAQMALRQADGDAAAASAGIHQRALAFIADLPHQEFLGDDSPKGHDEHMKDLISNFDVTARQAA